MTGQFIPFSGRAWKLDGTEVQEDSTLKQDSPLRLCRLWPPVPDEKPVPVIDLNSPSQTEIEEESEQEVDPTPDDGEVRNVLGSFQDAQPPASDGAPEGQLMPDETTVPATKLFQNAVF